MKRATPPTNPAPPAPAPTSARRNPGPSWGYRFLVEADRVVPHWLLRPALMAGTWIAVLAMPAQRRHSRAFLTLVLNRRVGWRDVWRHFFTFLEFLMVRLRAAHGGSLHCTVVSAGPATAAFQSLLDSGAPAFFGTFHFGYSDLLGFLLGGRGRSVAMIREKVANSRDTEWLERQFAGAVSFIWSNDPADLPFRLKAAIDAGASIALQCDRVEGSARTETFEFLGARRLFPFAIYHLAVLFERPVVFCLALPRGERELAVHVSPIFHPDPRQDRDLNYARAREHFAAVLLQLETLVRQSPCLWFNFQALNPEAPNHGR